MSLPITMSQNATKPLELDLVPTKMCSVEPDPSLLVTPEKPPLLKRHKHASGRVTEKKPAAKNKVRFDLPEISDNTSTESFAASGHNTVTDASSASTEFDEASSNILSDDTVDFSMKAALYTQRNPLADITCDSNHNYDTSVSSGTDGTTMSTFSELPLAEVAMNAATDPKIVDLRAKTKQNNPKSCNIIDIPANRSLPIYKTKLSKTSGHRKMTPIQVKIDELTAVHTHHSTEQNADEISEVSKSSYLKKKSGLHRHEHSVQYSQLGDKLDQNLEEPKYNSSLFAGQQLQGVKDQHFDAMTAVKKKLTKDDQFRAHVAVKAAAGTNIDPEEKLFTNLISLDVPLQESFSAELKKMKRPTPKSDITEGPNILSMYPTDLIQEKVVLDSRCYSVPSVQAFMPLVDAETALYQHSLCWDVLNCP